MHLVDLVKNLVQEYIKTENCLVLLAQAMSNDPNLSTAAGLVVTMKAQDRCIGMTSAVLSKVEANRSS